MSKIIDMGAVKPFDQLCPSKIVETVPIVMAMHVAAANAEKIRLHLPRAEDQSAQPPEYPHP